MASETSGTTATEIQLNPLARYKRNAWHYITEMGGTMTSELSKNTNIGERLSTRLKIRMD